MYLSKHSTIKDTNLLRYYDTTRRHSSRTRNTRQWPPYFFIASIFHGTEKKSMWRC